MLNAEQSQNHGNTPPGELMDDVDQLESQIQQKLGDETEEPIGKALDNWLSRNVAIRGCWR